MKSFVTIVLMSVLLAGADPSQAEQTVYFTWAEIKAKSEFDKKVAPQKGDFYEKCADAFPEKLQKDEPLSRDEVLAIESPKATQAYDYTANMPKQRSAKNMPKGAIVEAEALRQLTLSQKVAGDKMDLGPVLETKYGKQAWYHLFEIQDVAKNKAKPKEQSVDRPKDDPVGQIVLDIETRPETFLEKFKGPLIRESWRDVLYAEDPSQDDRGKQSLDDLVGATVSYTHDGNVGADTWATKGALILPWEHRFFLTQKPSFRRLVFVPSVSIDRNDTNGDPKAETDSLLYRMGLFADVHLWTSSERRMDRRPTSAGVQVRAAGVYATDSGMAAELPGFEVDLEPRIDFEPFPLGYRKIWVRKAATKDDFTDSSLFETQLRTWLHIEGGDVQRSGKTWEATDGDFCRLGPTAQFQALWHGGLFGRDLSFTGLGTYLPTVSGEDEEHEFYYKLTLSCDLFKEKTEEVYRKVSLNVGYENGGLSFSREQVDLFTFGLGILF